jgi:hypothetical protein
MVSWISPPSCVGIRQDDSIIRAEDYDLDIKTIVRKVQRTQNFGC